MGANSRPQESVRGAGRSEAEFSDGSDDFGNAGGGWKVPDESADRRPFPLSRGRFRGGVFRNVTGGMPDRREAASAISVQQPPTEDQPAPPNPALRSLVYERWLATHSVESHLAGAILPETDRTLAKPEAREVARRLLECLAGSTQESGRQAALTLLLSLLTGHPWQSVVGALACLAGGRPYRGDPGTWMTFDRFAVTVPGADAFAGVVDEVRPILHPVRNWFELPLPLIVSQAVEHAVAQTDAKRWREPPELWKEWIGELVQFLTTACPRTSLYRLRTVLPAAVWSVSHDMTATQFITGQHLDHSTAPLHYYNYPEPLLQEHYAAALRAWLPTDLHALRSTATSPGPQFVGAPLSAVRDEHIRNAVAALARRYQATARHRGSSLRRDLQAHSLLTIWTAAMFAAGTTHRLTGHLQLLRLRDLVWDVPLSDDERDDQSNAGWCVFMDKVVQNDCAIRTAVLPPMLVRQLQVYLGSVRRLAFTATLDRHRAIRRQLQAILDGSGALFQVFTAAGSAALPRLRPLTLKDIDANWPELQISCAQFRHRATSRARLVGMSPNDLRLLMGHSVGYQRFGADDPDAFIDFIRRTAPQVECMLEGDGWRVIGRSPAITAQGAMPAPLGVFAVCAVERSWAFIRQKRGTRLAKRLRQVDRSRIESGVKKLLRDAVPGFVGGVPPTGLELSESVARSLEAATDAAFGEPAERFAARNALRARIYALQSQAGWTGHAPRAVVVHDPGVQRFGPAVTRAFATAKALLAWGESQPPSGNNGPPDRATLALAVIELSVRGGLVRVPRLVAAIRGLPAAVAVPDRADAVWVPLAADASGQDEAVVLTGAVALLAMAWQRRWNAVIEVTAADLEAACRAVLPPALLGAWPDEAKPPRSLGVLKALLRVATLARRVTVPGVRSCWEEGTLVGSGLPIEREMAVLDNGSGAGVADAASPLGQTGCSRWQTVPDTADAAYLGWMRREMYRTLRGRRQKPRDQKPAAVARIEKSGASQSVQALVRVIREERERRAARSGTAWAFSEFACELLLVPLGSRRRRLQSAYRYVTALLTPCLILLKNGDLMKLDRDALQALLEALVLSSRDRNRALILALVHRLARIIARGGGASLVQEDWGDLDIPEVPPAMAYVLTGAEYERARRLLGQWAAEARAKPPADRKAHPLEFEAAAVLLAAGYYGAARIGEMLTRRLSDVYFADGAPVVWIRPHYEEPLKTTASHRIVLTTRWPERERRMLAALVNHQQQALAREPAPKQLFSLHVDGRRQYHPQRLVELVRQALTAVADPAAARFHAGRKAVATAASVHLLQCRGRAAYPAAKGTQDLQWIGREIDSIPAMQLAFVSRCLLGHGARATTLQHYMHLHGRDRLGGCGWPQPGTAGLARLGLLPSVGALRARASAKQISLRGLTVASAAILLDLAAPPPTTSDVVPPVTVIEEGAQGGATYRWGLRRIGRILRGLMRQEPSGHLAAAEGLAPAAIEELAVLAKRLRRHHRCGWMAELGETSRLKRVPHASRIDPVLRKAERLQENAVEWAGFVEIVARQQRFDGSFMAETRIEAAVLAQILEQLCERDREVRVTSHGQRVVLVPRRRYGSSTAEPSIWRFIAFVIALDAELRTQSELVNSARQS